MSALNHLFNELYRSARSSKTSGLVTTGIPGVTFFWSERSCERSPLLYNSGLIIVGQGQKIGYLGGHRFQYDAESCLVLGVPVPFECESIATPAQPILGLRLDLDLGTLHQLVARFGHQIGLESRAERQLPLGVAPLPLEGALRDSTARLLACLRDPLDAQILGPAARDEIVYRVLRSERGAVLYELTAHHGLYATIANALELIHRDYLSALSVEQLAKESAMGVSSFHRAFKQVTGESPVQYIKKVRLLKAKSLLVFEGLRVEEAAYQVGYASPSQFSREFKRYFCVPPSEAATLPYNDLPTVG